MNFGPRFFEFGGFFDAQNHLTTEHFGKIMKDTLLKYWEKVGADSIDGTGWMRARDKKFFDMIRWFEGDPQMKLFN